MIKTARLLFIIVSLSSCIARVPKYTNVEQVMLLKTGMTKDSVEKIIGIQPYDFKSLTNDDYVLVYRYRTVIRSVVPLFIRATNGKTIRGRWEDIFITYGKDDRVKDISSCAQCEVKQLAKATYDITSILSTMATLALPVVLVFLGLHK
jgi:hypothetical protein